MDKLDLCYYDEVRLKDGREGTIVEIWVSGYELENHYDETVLCVEFYDPDHKYEWPKGTAIGDGSYFLVDIRPCDVCEIIYKHPGRLKTG